jgi:hypothetical protein
MARQVMKPGRLIPRRPIPVLLCVLVGMLLAELGVRLLWRPSIVGTERYFWITPSFDFGFGSMPPVCIEDGDEWLCLPTQYRAGIRRQTLPRRKSPTAVRFVTLGGSVSQGGPESYTHQLRERLVSRHPAVEWESLNLSNYGYGTARMLVLLDAVPRLEPDFVILDCTGTNEFEDERDRARREYFNSGLGAVLYRSWALVLAKKWWSRRFDGDDAGPRYEGPSEQEAGAVAENVERWRASLDRNLSRMMEFAGERDLPVVLMGRSVREEIAPGSRFDRINEVIRSYDTHENVLYVDTQAVLHRIEDFEDLYREDGFHVNDPGHAVIADFLADSVVTGLAAIRSRVRGITEAGGTGR